MFRLIRQVQQQRLKDSDSDDDSSIGSAGKNRGSLVPTNVSFQEDKEEKPEPEPTTATSYDVPRSGTPGYGMNK
jgi:hypothetical protein